MTQPGKLSPEELKNLGSTFLGRHLSHPFVSSLQGGGLGTLARVTFFAKFSLKYHLFCCKICYHFRSLVSFEDTP